MGLPIDPSAGSTNKALLLRQVDRFLNIYDDNFRWNDARRAACFFTSNLNDALSVRGGGPLFERSSKTFSKSTGGNTGGGDPTVDLGSITTWGWFMIRSRPFAPSPARRQSLVMPRGGRRNPTRSQPISTVQRAITSYTHEIDT